MGVFTSVPILVKIDKKNATVRVLADGQIHRLTDANRFYNLFHAICYSYGTDNNNNNVVDRVLAAGNLNLSLLVPAIYNRKPKSKHTANPEIRILSPVNSFPQMCLSRQFAPINIPTDIFPHNLRPCQPRVTNHGSFLVCSLFLPAIAGVNTS